jgi:hypothetical protein
MLLVIKHYLALYFLGRYNLISIIKKIKFDKIRSSQRKEEVHKKVLLGNMLTRSMEIEK